MQNNPLPINNQMMKKILLIIVLSLFVATNTQARRFVHPGMSHTRADLEFLKSRVKAGEGVWIEEWNRFLAAGTSQSDYTPRPRAHVARGYYNRPDIGATDFLNDGYAAYALALKWYVDDDTVAAEKSIEILNGWSQTLDSITMGDQKLLIGMAGIHYLNAAEILKHTYSGWKAGDRRTFENMVLNIWYKDIKGFLPKKNGNWDAAMCQTMLCIGIFTDRRDIFEEACNHLLKGRTNAAINHYFYANGQCQESGRDQVHVQMGLSFLTAACQVAWNQGVDIYSACDNRLCAGYEYTAKYLLGEEVPYEQYVTCWGKKVFGPEISSRGRDNIFPMYALAYRHYHDRMGIEMPCTERLIRQSNQSYRSGTLPWSRLLNEGYDTCGRSDKRTSSSR